MMRYRINPSSTKIIKVDTAIRVSTRNNPVVRIIRREMSVINEAADPRIPTVIVVTPAVRE
jgi:hypothetical protein